jgi:uncharacterized membrane protein YjfL (UPF0719 family)
MSKMILVFAILFTCLYFGIQIFREFTYKEKWELIKVAGYAVTIAAMATFFLVGFVILF